MKKKAVIIAAAVLLGVPLLGVGVFALALDPIVRSGTERLATSALGVPTRLEAADVSLGGSADLRGLDVANPSGYQEPRSCRFDRLDAAVRLGSLFGDVVEVDHVDVVKPDLTIEFVGTKSNWSVLMDNLSKDRPKTPEEKESRKKFRIGRLKIEAATVRFRSDLLQGGAKSVTLPTIELKNLGTAENAATMGEVLATVFQTLAAEAMKSGHGILPAQLLDGLKGEIAGAARKFEGMLDDATRRIKDLPGKLLEDPAKQLQDKVQDQLNDLFKKK